VVDVDSGLGSLHRVDVGSVTDVSVVYALSVFRVEAGRISECPCTYRFWPNRRTGGKCLVLANRRTEMLSK
jgi:hypothetical protein